MEDVHLNDGDPDLGYEYFKEEILKLTGINLHFYKEKQMKRRINALMGRKGIADYREYVCLLQKDPEAMAFFIDYITINVTEFFRTADHWQYFEENVLRELIDNKGGSLRIWSCACSTGEEPYSLIMNMAEQLPIDQIQVIATDVDRNVLRAAQEGIYQDKGMEKVPEEMKQKYFRRTNRGWEISEEVKKCVEFMHLDLLRDEYPSDLDLILCRNVLIYFTEAAKSMVYQRFYDALAEGGYLFTGNTEQIIQYKSFGYKKQMNFIYKK